MPTPVPDPPTADRNLLFGILALQMDFIDRDQLIAAMHAWVLDKQTSLGEILLRQGALRGDTFPLLDALVNKHLELHGGDPQKSLAAVNSVESLRRDLEQFADADVQASLAHVSADRREEKDPWRTEPPAAAVAGPQLRFSILRPHAKGGLGEVFVARDQELHREVALKEIRQVYADDPDRRSRFVLEAEITGGLEHPGIIPVYGLGTYPDGRPFYAMRFVRGETLRNAIERFHQADVPRRDAGERALALRELLRRFVDVCNAIAYAHSRGVLHRDLKPDNIMLGQYGETLVVDWGLAKATGHPEAEGELAEATLRPPSAAGAPATQMGAAFGTPQFMPPEQAAGRLDQMSPATDIYSLGATLYCLLTGQAPFDGRDLGEVLRKVQQGAFPQPRHVKNEVPPALEAICSKAMARLPQDRYASVEKLREDIERWLAGEAVSVYRDPRVVSLAKWCRRRPLLALYAICYSCVGIVAALYLLAGYFGPQAPLWVGCLLFGPVGFILLSLLGTAVLAIPLVAERTLLGFQGTTMGQRFQRSIYMAAVSLPVLQLIVYGLLALLHIQFFVSHRANTSQDEIALLLLETVSQPCLA
jgi:serine/threonine-protein kinase